MVLLKGLTDNATGRELFRAMLEYIFSAQDEITVNDVRSAVRDQLSAKEEEEAMTIAEKLRTEGIEHGIREDVQEILEERFGEVPQNIVYKLSRVHDVGILRRMHRLALRTESTDEFCRRLEENRES